MAGNIFISYRRDDAAAWAGRLHLALQKYFKPQQLFMDVDNIPAGHDFVKVLDKEVAKCDVLLAVIGKSWVAAAGASGARRVDDPNDFVRIEIASALKRDIRVIPILVDGAAMPEARDLPAEMEPLIRRQAFTISHSRFGSDTEALAKQLGHVFTAGPNWQANWAGMQSELARWAGQSRFGGGGAQDKRTPQPEAADTARARGRGWSQPVKILAWIVVLVGWSFASLIIAALLVGPLGIRSGTEAAYQLIGLVGLTLACAGYWAWRRRQG